MFQDLYQEIILDHYRNPRNFQPLEDVPATEHENPVCGDRIKLFIKVNKEGMLEEILFDGSGCAVSMSSASMMTEAVKGRSLEEVKKVIQDFLAVMRGEKPKEVLESYGELVALSGIAQFPVRVKCATLAWHALEERISENQRGMTHS